MRAALLAVLLAAPARAAAPAGAAVRVEAETWRYRLLEVSFPSPLPSGLAPVDLVRAHLYLPRSRRRPPCVLILPVMAAPNVWIEARFARALTLSGYAVMWLEMPHQFQRRPNPLSPSGQSFLARTAGGLGRNFRQARADALAALAWLESSGLVDERRIGVFGISLGAMVGASMLAVDGRPRAAILALGGADFPDLVMRGEMTAEFARAMGIRASDLGPAWRGLDPLDHRRQDAGASMVLINARGDKVIPERNALRLKEAFPRARQFWVPFGHYGAILHLAWMPDYVVWRFARLWGL